MENFLTNISEELILYTAKYSPILLKKIVYLLILYFTYRPVREFLVVSLKKILKKSTFDELLVNFLLTSTNLLIIIFYFLNLLEILGLKTTSILALIGSIGVGVGLALKGSLSDVAGGIQILVSKPFKKGDFIIAAGTEGAVQKISFLYTVLNSVDNKKIIVPNGKLSSSIVTTVTANPQRRADFLFFADKKCNIDKVREVLFNVVSNHPAVLKEKDIFVKFAKETSTASEFIVRVWTLKENFRDLNADIQEEVKKRFDLEGIRIPYQSYDVNIIPPR
ncbi:mechanosensitive ion channel [Cetobacterium somerae]|uniref:mechanosensitive ion channel family protein n=1 Tax=Cetobacterium sp. NK01 TaxID=2993530 RepID=UPI002116EBCD|nr:mechanosensitive ion channel domain-containing protein [Cetobacterium sp. NK01]MCQ8213114.1 mechanosensitive ion channel [Cetobacterium sp. NK01]